MIKFKPSFIITLALLATAHYFYGKEIITSLLLVYLSMLLISSISLLFSKRHIKATMSLENKKFTVDESFKIHLNINNKSLFLYPYINFSSDSSTIEEKLETSFSLLPIKKLRLKLKYKLNSRGTHTLPSYFLEVKDMFFISSRKINFNNDLTITVYPKDIELPLDVQKSLEIACNSSRSKISLHLPDTPSSIDKYIPGDSIKNIHWKVSAKRNDLYVKKFDTLTKQSIAMYIDMTDCFSLSKVFNNLNDENLVAFSLSLVKHLLYDNELIDLTVENLKSDIFKLESTAGYYTLLSYYLEHKSTGKGNFFNKVLEKTLQNIESYKSTFIITYTIFPNDIEPISRLATSCDNLVIFTLLEVDSNIKNLLSSIAVNVVTVAI